MVLSHSFYPTSPIGPSGSISPLSVMDPPRASWEPSLPGLEEPTTPPMISADVAPPRPVTQTLSPMLLSPLIPAWTTGHSALLTFATPSPRTFDYAVGSHSNVIALVASGQSPPWLLPLSVPTWSTVLAVAWAPAIMLLLKASPWLSPPSSPPSTLQFSLLPVSFPPPEHPPVSSAVVPSLHHPFTSSSSSPPCHHGVRTHLPGGGVLSHCNKHMDFYFSVSTVLP